MNKKQQMTLRNKPMISHKDKLINVNNYKKDIQSNRKQSLRVRIQCEYACNALKQHKKRNMYHKILTRIIGI